MIDDIREWISDNLRYILLGAAAILILLMVVLVIRLIHRPSPNPDNGGVVSQPNVQTVENGGEDDGSDVETVLTEDDFEFETEMPDSQVSDLVQDDAEVLTLMKEYYAARASKDLTALSQIVTPWDSSTQNDVLQSDLIESYNEVTTYSESGLDDDSFVVFTCFKAKIPDYETLVPSLRMQYLVTENDTLKVLANYESDDEIAGYVATVAKAADVQQLLSRVNSEYEAALNSDPDLKAYLTDLTTDASSGDEGEEQENSGAGEVRTALYGLNIRQETSTESAVLGGVPANGQVTVLEDVEDGWSKISFDPGTGEVTGYVRTEYLAAAEQ